MNLYICVLLSTFIAKEHILQFKKCNLFNSSNSFWPMVTVLLVSNEMIYKLSVIAYCTFLKRAMPTVLSQIAVVQQKDRSLSSKPNWTGC